MQGKCMQYTNIALEYFFVILTWRSKIYLDITGALSYVQAICLLEILKSQITCSITTNNLFCELENVLDTVEDLYNTILYNAMIHITHKFLNINNPFYNYRNIDTKYMFSNFARHY